MVPNLPERIPPISPLTVNTNGKIVSIHREDVKRGEKIMSKRPEKSPQTLKVKANKD
jgi:hypothetical protein